MKRYSSSLAIQELPTITITIATNLSNNHYKLIKMAKMKNGDNTKC